MVSGVLCNFTDVKLKLKILNYVRFYDLSQCFCNKIGTKKLMFVNFSVYDYIHKYIFLFLPNKAEHQREN